MDNKVRLKKRYRQFFRQVPVMAALLDVDGHFLDVSDRWAKRTGYETEELRGKDPAEFATPESARRIRHEYLPGFHRTGRLDDVVKTVVFLIEDALFMTGAVLRLDGGYVLGGEQIPGMPDGLLP